MCRHKTQGCDQFHANVARSKLKTRMGSARLLSVPSTRAPYLDLVISWLLKSMTGSSQKGRQHSQWLLCLKATQ